MRVAIRSRKIAIVSHEEAGPRALVARNPSSQAIAFASRVVWFGSSRMMSSGLSNQSSAKSDTAFLSSRQIADNTIPPAEPRAHASVFRSAFPGSTRPYVQSRKEDDPSPRDSTLRHFRSARYCESKSEGTGTNVFFDRSTFIELKFLGKVSTDKPLPTRDRPGISLFLACQDPEEAGFFHIRWRPTRPSFFSRIYRQRGTIENGITTEGKLKICDRKNRVTPGSWGEEAMKGGAYVDQRGDSSG